MVNVDSGDDNDANDDDGFVANACDGDDDDGLGKMKLIFSDDSECDADKSVDGGGC